MRAPFFPVGWTIGLQFMPAEVSHECIVAMAKEPEWLAKPLQDAGFMVHKASRRSEAVNLVAQYGPCLVLTDPQGTPAPERLARDHLKPPQDQPHPLLVQFVPRKQAGRAATADITLPYPENDTELLETVRALLRPGRARQERESPEGTHALQLTQFAIDRAAYGAVWVKPDATLYYANEACCNLLGYPREQLLELSVFDVNPDFTSGTWQEHWEALKRAGSMTFESRLQARNGDIVPVEISAHYITLAGREYNCAHIRDLRAQKQTEAILEIRARQQAAIAALSRDAVKGVSVACLQQETVRRVAEVFGVEFCGILELHETDHTLRPIAAVGWPAEAMDGAEIPVDSTNQAGYTLLSDEPVVVADFDQETRFGRPPLLRDHGVVSGISVVIPGHERPWGVLGAHSTAKRVFSVDDLNFFQSVAHVLAEAMHRQRMDASLRESEMMLRVAGRTARLGGWVVDLADARIIWSDETCAIHDMPPGTTLSLEEGIAFYAPEWQEHVRDVFYACAENGVPFDEEMALISRTGRHVWIRAIGEPVRDDSGAIVQVRGAIQDITEKKVAEQEVAQLAERLTNTLESITDAFFTLDSDWRFTYLNEEAQRLLGRRREELLGRSVWEEFPATVDSEFETEYRRAVREHRPVEFDAFYEPLETWFEVRAYPSDEGLAVYFHDITDRKEAEEEINFLALYDSLTHLPNRKLFHDRLTLALGASTRRQHYGATLLLDLDHFKTLNESLGHQIGDILLQQVAKRLRTCLREIDTVARFGGDEFGIILEQLSRRRDEAVLQAEAVAQKILWEFNAPFHLAERERLVTPSIGITLFGGSEETADELLKQADVAMYQAKASGRNTARVFKPEMQTAVSHRVELETEIREALQRGEFVPYFQPQVNIENQVIGAEALVRWQHPQHGILLPGTFIPVAEETGLIESIGADMLASVCQQLAAWSSHPETGHLSIAVNVSAREFHNPDFVTQVMETIHRAGAQPSQLKLELTETLLLADVEDTIKKMSDLKSQGVRFSLDDFGTGYSSLYYVKRLPLDELKIDQRFVRDVLTDANDAAIMRAVVVLAQSLGLRVIAEGVETREVRDFLAEQGCAGFQGFLFSHPLPLEDFQRYLDRYPVAAGSN